MFAISPVQFEREVLKQPHKVSYMFDGDRLPLNFIAEHSHRRLSLIFGIENTVGDGPWYWDEDPQRCPKTAGALVSELRTECLGGIFRAALRSLKGSDPELFFAAPYWINDGAGLRYDISVPRSTHFDRTYNFVKSFLDGHDLNVDRHERRASELLPLQDLSFHGFQWTESAFEAVEKMPREDESHSDHMNRISSIHVDGESDFGEIDYRSEEYRAGVLARAQMVRHITPAGWSALLSLRELFEASHANSVQIDEACEVESILF